MPASTDLARRKLGTGIASLGEANEILNNLDNAAKVNEANTFTATQTTNSPIETKELGPVTFGVAANTSLAAAGNAIGNAAALPNATFSVYPITGANGVAACQIQTGDAVTGREFELVNYTSGQYIRVFPPVNGTINNQGANTGYNGATGASILILCTAGGATPSFRAFSST